MADQISIQLNFVDFDFWTKRIKLELVKNEAYELSIKKQLDTQSSSRHTREWGGGGREMWLTVLFKMALLISAVLIETERLSHYIT